MTDSDWEWMDEWHDDGEWMVEGKSESEQMYEWVQLKLVVTGGVNICVVEWMAEWQGATGRMNKWVRVHNCFKRAESIW